MPAATTRSSDASAASAAAWRRSRRRTGTLIAYATLARQGRGRWRGRQRALHRRAPGRARHAGGQGRGRVQAHAHRRGRQVERQSDTVGVVVADRRFLFRRPERAAASGADAKTMVWSSVKDSRSPAVVQDLSRPVPPGPPTRRPLRAMIDDFKRAADPGRGGARPRHVAPRRSSRPRPRGVRPVPQAEATAPSRSPGRTSRGRRRGAQAPPRLRGDDRAIRVCNQSTKAPCRALLRSRNSLVIDRYAAFDTASAAALPQAARAQLAAARYGEEDADFQAPTTALRTEKYPRRDAARARRRQDGATKELLALIVGRGRRLLIDVRTGPRPFHPAEGVVVARRREPWQGQRAGDRPLGR